jgi:hypothetical protein
LVEERAMAVSEQGPGGGGLRRRVMDILFTPGPEWDRIDAEPATVKGLYLGYACILAAIGPVARFIGGQIFGRQGIFLTVHPSLISSLAAAIVDYGLSLAGVFVLGLVIDVLAPSFGGTRSRIQGLKVAIYAWTAAWVFAVFQLVPPVGGLSVIGGLYSLYLMYLGIPKLMKAPDDKAALYSIVTVVVAMAIWIVITIVAAMLVRGSLV